MLEKKFLFFSFFFLFRFFETARTVWSFVMVREPVTSAIGQHPRCSTSSPTEATVQSSGSSAFPLAPIPLKTTAGKIVEENVIIWRNKTRSRNEKEKKKKKTGNDDPAFPSRFHRTSSGTRVSHRAFNSPLNEGSGEKRERERQRETEREIEMKTTNAQIPQFSTFARVCVYSWQANFS